MVLSALESPPREVPPPHAQSVWVRPGRDCPASHRHVARPPSRRHHTPGASRVQGEAFVIRVSGGFMFRVSCFVFRGFWVSGVGLWASGFWFWILDFRFWVSGFGFRVSGFGFRVSGFGSRVSGFGFQGFRVSGFGFQVSSFGFCVSSYVFQGVGVLELQAPPAARSHVHMMSTSIQAGRMSTQE